MRRFDAITNSIPKYKIERRVFGLGKKIIYIYTYVYYKRTEFSRYLQLARSLPHWRWGGDNRKKNPRKPPTWKEGGASGMTGKTKNKKKKTWKNDASARAPTVILSCGARDHCTMAAPKLPKHTGAVSRAHGSRRRRRRSSSGLPSKRVPPTRVPCAFGRSFVRSFVRSLAPPPPPRIFRARLARPSTARVAVVCSTRARPHTTQRSQIVPSPCRAPANDRTKLIFFKLFVIVAGGSRAVRRALRSSISPIPETVCPVRFRVAIAAVR